MNKLTKNLSFGEYATPKARIVVLENEGPLCASFGTFSIASWVEEEETLNF